MMRAMRWILVVAAMMGATLAQASKSDEETKAIFASLLKEDADSVVRVSFVIVSSSGGQEQRQESSVTGAIVDATGLVLVPKLVVDPSFPGMNRMSAEQRMGFKLERRRFQFAKKSEHRLDAFIAAYSSNLIAVDRIWRHRGIPRCPRQISHADVVIADQPIAR